MKNLLSSVPMEKLMLLNCNKKTYDDMSSALPDTSIVHINMREVIAHIPPESEPRFIHNNSVLSFSDTCVFSRFHIIDAPFTGILHEYLQHKEIRFINSINTIYDEASDKIAQMSRFALANLPIPETFVVRAEAYENNAHYIHEHIHFPVICKTNGRKGSEVHLIKSANELKTYIVALPEKTRFLIQEYIPNTFDIRVIVAFGEIIGAIRRTSESSFLNNLSQGGKALPYELTEQERALAIEATAATHLDIGGVDIIHKDTTPVLLEVNRSPGVLGFESVHTDEKVFSKIAHILATKHT